jgi:hypothetical protein
VSGGIQLNFAEYHWSIPITLFQYHWINRNQATKSRNHCLRGTKFSQSDGCTFYHHKLTLLATVNRNANLFLSV